MAELTTQERSERTAAYLRRSLARPMGLDATGTKAAIGARIVEHAAKSDVQRATFDMSGLVIHCAPLQGSEQPEARKRGQEPQPGHQGRN